MSTNTERIAAEKEALKEARQKGGFAVLKTYFKFSGPGWLQGAITLGGGSLAGSLYLGIYGGFSLLWVQPVAMIMGVIMLSAITYFTLSTGRRPLKAINDHVNPVLGWGWAVATLMANIVWCLPQFTLGNAAVQQNLVPALNSSGGTFLICAALLAVSVTIIWFYDSGSKGIRIFEYIIKGLVGLVVLCFFGVVIKMALSRAGLPWGEMFAGFVPDFSLLLHPAASFNDALSATGEYSSFWREKTLGLQRDVMIASAATAVGINMTFLLPYSMLRKGWDRESRGLAIFDLGTGLFVPFMLATSCVVIASASQFHSQPQPGLLEGTASQGMQAKFQSHLSDRLRAELNEDELARLSDEQKAQRIAGLPEGDKRMAAMLVKRDAFDLAQSLENLTGKTFSQYIFGLGVLGMSLSTIIILMLISGFTICELFNLPHGGMYHRLGCLIPAVGVFGPAIWSGKTQVWLAVPTSVFGMTLLPIAYFTFFLMMNHRGLMGDQMLRGGKRVGVNILMLVALGLATFAAVWTIWNKVQWYGIGLLGLFILAAVVVHFVRPPKKVG